MIPWILATLLGAPPTCGPLDLATAQALASARSDEVSIRRADVLSAEADLAIARAARWFPISSATLIGGLVPEARGTIFVPTAGDNRSLNGLGPFARIEVNVVQPLWTWGQLDAAKDAAEAGIRARSHLVDDMLQQIRQRVLSLFYAVTLTRRLLAIGVEVEAALNDVDKQIAESLAEGDGIVTQEDKYRVVVFRAELNQKKADAEKALALARSALAGTLATKESDLVLKDEILPGGAPTPIPALEESVKHAETDRPDLLALNEAIRARDEAAHAAWAAQLPQLFLAGGFVYSRAPNRDIQNNPWIRDDFNLTALGAVLGLRQNLAFPLLHAQVEKAEAEAEALRRQRDGLIRLVQLDVEKALADLTAASKRHAAARGALSAGKSWFRAAAMNFSLNVTDARGLLEAYSAYVKTQIDETQAAYDFLVASGHLDQVTAKPIPKGDAPCLLR